ncbi:hypothetical protein BG011_004453 [Mortierella polycephala]|uniref:Uncharacterized protein n=1 Tax=Mortierella polycephala TaxID=41804 RepID=A0A9P6U2A7_9FUNG|nr:hypothetical protein BG011_004453 [Mortierella polycephala]
MTKFIETPPLINITPLAEIHEVPIHINHPIHPTSANKHKRLGLQILNELSRVEMFVTKIETVGKQDEISTELTRTISHLEQTLYAFEMENGPPGRLDNISERMLLQRYMIRTGLIEMFPKSSEYLGIERVIPGGNFLQSHYHQMASINQLVSIAMQLRNDLRLSNHKFIAHQVALLYQCINQAGPAYAHYKARVEEQFNTFKEICNTSEEPQLSPELQSWQGSTIHQHVSLSFDMKLSEIVTDIVSEALFSGRPMSQQTPEAAHLSNYINRVSSGNSWVEQTTKESMVQ